MLVDTQPATHQHQPASAEVRDLWVNARLIGVLMDNMGSSVFASVMVLPIVVFLLAGEVATVLLVAWAVCAFALLLYRYHLISVYQMQYDSYEGPQRQAFADRYRWTWDAAGLMWGFVTVMVYLQASVPAQFVCGLLILGQGVISLGSFSAYEPAFKGYLRALTLATAAGIVINVALKDWDSAYWQQSAVLLVLLGIFWYLTRKTGMRLNAIHRASFELQFSNEELIESLTQQTRASLRAVEAKNRFLASAAHDLRQPVHALSLYADWLVTEPEMAKDIAPRMLQSTRAINELFDSLFDLTRIDAGNYKVHLQAVDVLRLFEELVTQFAPVAANKALSLRTDAKPRSIWADPVVLRRILGNLLSNALKHTSHGGVLVALRQRKASLVFEVWDTGVGIAHEHQMAIFQEFFRVSQHQGTEDSLGLGLTIVSKLTTLMGYQLAVSSHEGRGSVFRVILPAFTQSAAVSEPVVPEVLLGSEFGALK
jgi:signal transduction histidine kinase